MDFTVPAEAVDSLPVDGQSVDGPPVDKPVGGLLIRGSMPEWSMAG